MKRASFPSGGQGSSRAGHWRDGSGMWRFGLMLLLLALVAFPGCGCRDETPMLDDQRGRQGAAGIEQELFSYAIDSLNQLENYNSAEMLTQIVNRLDQWIAEQPEPPGWAPDPMLQTLPAALRQLPPVEQIGRMDFQRTDGAYLQQAVWLRDVAAWAAGDQVDPLSQSRHLFDWTVRNVALDRQRVGVAGAARDDPRLGQQPWETLMLGRGTSIERAWVFMLLLRQRGIPSALLGIPNEASETRSPTRENDARREASTGALSSVDAWAVGVLIEGEVYLFDAALGLPIPAPEGPQPAADRGGLAIPPATLAEASTSPAVLSRLDLDEDTPYPVAPERLEQLVALIPASPEALSRRMLLVESYLVGDQRMVLTVDPSSLAERFQAVDGIAAARLWTYPYVVLAQQMESSERPEAVRRRLDDFAPYQVGVDQPLWKGRILHFEGKFVGENSATHYYQAARPSNADLDQLAEFYYQGMKQVRPEQSELELRDMAQRRAKAEYPLYVRAKQDASFWLGLISYERGVYEAAIDYFQKRVLAPWPDGPWRHAAHYNLGRTFAAEGQIGRAVGELISDPLSPSHYGNLLRARWLSELDAAELDAAGSGAEPGGPSAGDSRPGPTDPSSSEESPAAEEGPGETGPSEGDGSEVPVPAPPERSP